MPRPEHSFRQAWLAQSSPPQPASHSQEKGATHTPWPEQLAGHPLSPMTCEQSAPPNPRSHVHPLAPSAHSAPPAQIGPQLPWPLHPYGHDSPGVAVVSDSTASEVPASGGRRTVALAASASPSVASVELTTAAITDAAVGACAALLLLSRLSLPCPSSGACARHGLSLRDRQANDRNGNY